MPVSKREGELKSKFWQAVKLHLPGFYLLQYSTKGAPDRTIIGAGCQTNWEMKHATPSFDSPSDQELMCCRLAIAAHCRYILWSEHKGVQRTLIVHPNDVRLRTSWNVNPEAFCVGFDMRWLAYQIRLAHRL